jgi:membrane protein YdbS with pleckstrin-like domain
MSDADPSTAREHLLALDPRYTHVLRARTALRALPLILAVVVLEAASPVRGGWLSVPACLIAILAVLLLPSRQYARWRYQASEDRLQVVRGILFRSDTVVPFGRVQHIDVHQGPLERAWQLGSLTLFTAGTHNASVTLPGLPHAQALAMRETIRARIRQDTM